MTMAISKAAEDGAKAVICASTGNTSASRGRLRGPGRDDLRGARAAGQDRARQDGAGARARRAAAAGRRQLRRLPRTRAQARRGLPGRAGQLGEPVPHRGPEDRRVRDLRLPRRRPRRALHPGRQRRQHHRVLEGLHASTPPTASSHASARAMFGFQAAGAAPIVHGAPVTAPVDDRHGDPHRQPGVVGPGARPRATSPAASSTRSPTEQILEAYRLLARRRGCSSSRRRRPASPACCRCTRTAGSTRVQRVVCTVTGHGLKDPEWAIAGAPKPITVPVDAPRGRRRARPGVMHARRASDVPRRAHARARPRDQRQPRPGLRRARSRARPLRRRRRAGVRRRRCPVDVHGEGADAVPRDEPPPRREGHARGVRRARRTAARRCDLVCANRIPHGRGLGSSAAAIVAGVLLARALVVGGDGAAARRRRCSSSRRRSRATPTTSPPACSAG